MRPLKPEGSEVLMFEDSLVESQSARASATKRWTVAGSTALQVAIAATLVTLPLLHPERLRFHVEAPLVFTPPPPTPPVKVIEREPTAASSNPFSVPTSTQPVITLIPHDPGPLTETPPSFGPISIAMGTGNALPTAFTGTGEAHGSSVVMARPEPAKRLTISSGVSAGMLLSPIRPVYPTIAKAAGISGTVVVEAVISKAGTVESLRVVTGPELLRCAALDALRMARYRPYLLNGEPTEVQTTFTVNFRLGA